MSKILLVEDDNNLREIYEARLMAEGYTIVTAPDGEAALAIASQEKPDLVISDVMMPNISGFDMLDIMRNTEGLRNVHVIMLTALSQAEDQARADALGADRYLVKSQVTLEDIVNNAKVLLGDNEPAPAPAAPAAPEPVAAPVAAAPIVADVPVAAPPEPAQVSLPEPVITDQPVVSEPVVVAPPVEPVTVTPEPVAAAPVIQPVTAPPEPAVVPQPTPAEPVVVDTPVLTPEPIVQPQVVEPASAEPAPVNDPTNGLSETLAQEEADIQAQINAFANQGVPTPEPVQPTVETPPAAEPVAQQPVSAESQQPVTEPQPAPAPVETAPATPVEDPVVSVPTDPVVAPPEVAQTQPTSEPAAPQPVVAEPVQVTTQPEPVMVPAPVEQPVNVETPTPTSNDQLISAAVDQLSASVQPGVTNGVQQPVVIQPSAAPAPVEQPAVQAPQSNTNVDPAQNPAAPAPEGPAVPKPASDGGTKVIQPISNPEAKPDINQLLAQEEAKEQGQGNVMPSSIAPQQPTTPNNTVRPEDIAL